MCPNEESLKSLPGDASQKRARLRMHGISGGEDKRRLLEPKRRFREPTKRTVRASSAISTKRIRGDCEARTHKRRPRARQVRAHEVSRITVGIYLRPFSSAARRPREWNLSPFVRPLLCRAFGFPQVKEKKRKETWTNSAESNRLENFQPGSEDSSHFVERKLTRWIRVSIKGEGSL